MSVSDGPRFHSHLPENLRQAVRQQRLLPVVGLGIPDFIQGSTRPQYPYKQESTTRTLVNLLEAASEHLLPLYEAVAAMPCECALALTPDRHLAGLLFASGWQCVVSGHREIDERRRLLIQLAGSTDSPATLVLTDEDWLATERRDPVLWELAQGHAARAPLLLLGCDPGDQRIEEVVSDLRPNRHFRSTGWLLCSTISKEHYERWSDRGFYVVCGVMADLLEELREAGLLSEQNGRVTAPPITKWKSPYKHLDYFLRDDWPLFFGRKSETRRLVDLVCAHRLVVVTGPSGTGKTSLLQAGLLAWSDSHSPFVGVYSRCGEDPEQSVITAVQNASRAGRNRSSGHHDLLDVFEQFVESGQGIPIVVLDQAEELFTRFNEPLRERFLVTIRTCLTRPNLPVRFVLAVRDDFLGRLASLRDLLPSLLQNTFYVPPLTKEAALAAIREPCIFFGVPFDENLAETILDEIGGQRVAPPQIQIVCDYLFYSRSGTGITSELYERVGGARKILAYFMDEQLSRLRRRESLARDVLKAMVTSEGTKDVLGPPEIALRARRKEDDINDVLLLLRDTCRLVRTISEGDQVRFELAHEYLTTTIWEWMSQDDKNRREMEELLIKELRSWRQFRTIRLGLDRLRRFTLYSHVLEFDAEALTLMLLSSITHQYEPQIWVRSVRQLKESLQDQVSERLFAYFQDADLNQRCEAAEVIAQLDPVPLLRALESPSVQTRKAAIEMLGGMGLSSSVPQITLLLSDADEECRILACGALGAIGGSDVVQTLREVTLQNDLPLACAAIRALGRNGIAESCYDLVLTVLSSSQPTLVESAKSVIARGQSPGVVEFLLEQKLTTQASETLWQALLLMPISSKPWFDKVLAKLRNETLKGLPRLPLHNWVGYEVEYERLKRGLPSVLRLGRQTHRADSTPNFDQLLATGCSVEDAARVLQSVYRQVAITEFARRGKSIHVLLEGLAVHNAPDVRTALLEILIGQGDKSDRAFAEHQATKMALGDTDATVRSMACQLTAHLELWNILERVLRAEDSGKTRANVLHGLIDAPPNIVVPEPILRDILTNREPAERYWGCLFAGSRHLIEVLDLIRPLAWDQTSIAPRRNDRSWPYHDSKVGDTVADAANAALAVLSPSSAIWRQHGDWQMTFRG